VYQVRSACAYPIPVIAEPLVLGPAQVVTLYFIAMAVHGSLTNEQLNKI